jgi:hypothetical protein
MAFRDLPLANKLFKNVDETSLTQAYAALQNAFVTEASGLSRFPGLKEFVDLGGDSPVYMDKFSNDLIAVSGDGRTFRINRSANFETIPGTPVLGGRRVSFGRTSNQLVMAAGDQIIQFDGKKNSVLSRNAPLSSFVGVIDNYVVAVEAGSGRFQYSKPNAPNQWDPIDTFAADGRADNINAMLITPFNELLMAGVESIEQFERYANSDTPFFRRWTVGDGVIEPGTFCFADNTAWGLNERYEIARFSGQTSTVASNDINKNIQDIYSVNHLESFNEAWASALDTKGQKFLLFQSPEAVNQYGTKGVTYLFDLRQNRWTELFGWDSKLNVPTKWPGVSIFRLWGKTFVGGAGKIYELTDAIHNNGGEVQRMFCRTAIYKEAKDLRINDLRLTVKRGTGTYTTSPKVAMRVNPDQQGFGLWQFMELGESGDDQMLLYFGAQGTASTWQFEFMVTDDCDVEIRQLEIDSTSLER